MHIQYYKKITVAFSGNMQGGGQILVSHYQPIHFIPQSLTLDALYHCQLLSQRVPLAELARAQDLADMRSDSAEVYTMYTTPFRSMGKEERSVYFRVLASMCTLSCVSQYSTLRATTVTAMVGLRFPRDEPQVFFKSEFILLSMGSKSTPMSSKARSVCLETCEKATSSL